LNETNKERIYEQQAKLISKVQLEEIESKLNGPDVSKAELDRVMAILSNELLKVEKVLFQDKCFSF